LHIPLTVMLLGIVLRGSAFVFRQYGKGEALERARWGRVFAWSSVLTPLMLGVCFGALLTGEILVEDGVVRSGFFAGWTTPFAWAIGGLVVAQSTFLAAVYLANETEGGTRKDLRTSALRWGVATGGFAALALTLAATQGEVLATTLLRPRAIPFHIATGLLAIAALAALAGSRFRLARMLAVLQVTLVVAGGAVSLFPLAVPPLLSFEAAASPDSVLRGTLILLACGAVLLIPAFAWLMWIFKGDVLLRSRAED
jgi:cytochrome d ubiquinol oxidase subunit II